MDTRSLSALVSRLGVELLQLLLGLLADPLVDLGRGRALVELDLLEPLDKGHTLALQRLDGVHQVAEINTGCLHD